MARPIKETPVLTGKDAIIFMEDMENAKTQKVSIEERKRIMDNYKKFKAITNFSF
jgi:uncharacterized protein YktA (UPF0223 family)